MAGWELYERFVKLNSEMINCEIESWEALTQEERDVWNALAEGL